MSAGGDRVVWHEGLFLRPQHFQQQERFFEWLIGSTTEYLSPFAFGFADLKLDESQRHAGKLSIRAARGRTPDGSTFDVDAGVNPVGPVTVPDGTRDKLVYLYAWSHQSQTQSFQLGPPGHFDDVRLRHRLTQRHVQDNTSTKAEPLELTLGALALGLCLEPDLDSAMTALPVARVIERQGNDLRLDDAFIPPMLNATANARITRWLRELCELSRQRAQAVVLRIGQQGSKGAPDFLMLQTCNRYEPLLAQWIAPCPIHPFSAHQELLKFAGECALHNVQSRRPPTFPTYNHLDLASTLEPVINEIRRTLGSTPDQTAVKIPIQRASNGYYGAEIPQADMFRSGCFILGVQAEIPEDAVGLRIPPRTRIAAAARTPHLVNAQIPGLRLKLLQPPPLEISYHKGFSYFRLEADDTDQSEKFWPEIEKTRTLVMHFSGDFPGLNLELWWTVPS